MAKQNCWQIKHCGREPGGNQAEKLGICPTATAEDSNGLNDGFNGGRYCWRIVGTMCAGDTYGLFAARLETCGNCEVFHTIIREEGTRFTL